MRIVITGANRGIGLELTRQMLARGDSVIAAARHPKKAEDLESLRAKHPDRLRVLPVDVSSDKSVKALAESVTSAVDALINNAGTSGESSSLGALDFDDALDVYSVNALGPLRMTRAFLPHLHKGEGKRVLHVTSGMGSIGDNSSGGFYGYRMSKAALNMASRSLAADLRGEGILSAVINPGWVRTDMGGPRATVTVKDSATGILAQLDALTADQSGQFLDYSGKTWEW